MTIAVESQCKQLRSGPKKKVFRTSTGFQPVASAFVRQCSTSLAKCDGHIFISFVFPGAVHNSFHMVEYIVSQNVSPFTHISNICCWSKMFFSLRSRRLSSRGGTQQSFIRGGSAPRSKPSPFYVPFLIEKVPLLHTSHRKWYPFHIPSWGFKIICPFQIPK